MESERDTRDRMERELLTAYHELFDIPFYKIAKYYETRGKVKALRKCIDGISFRISQEEFFKFMR